MTPKAFVSGLAQVAEDGQPIHNPYLTEVCRYNLLHYLRFLQTVKVDVMLVGEAPGYRGCARTGVPFTDEVQLMSHDNDFALGDWKRNPNTGACKEGSATAVWQVLREHKVIPLIWNSFPFHPYGQKPNRSPTRREVEAGKKYIDQLRSMFSIDNACVFAVGRKAQHSLGLGDDHYLIHPARGHQQQFAAQFREKVLPVIAPCP